MTFLQTKTKKGKEPRMRLHSDAVKQAARKLCSELTLRERIGQMIQFDGRTLKLLQERYSDQEIAEKYPMGSFFCGGEIIEKAGRNLPATSKIEGLKDMFNVPLLICGDLENRVDNKYMPNQATVGAADDIDLAYRFGKTLAEEAVNRGYHWTFSPNVDLTKSILSRCGTRSLGSDPDKVSALSIAIMKGLQDHGVIATTKHFPGAGKYPFFNPHLTAYVNDTDREFWEATVGKVFRNAIEAGTYAIMTTHVGLSFCDESGLPATLSRKITTDLLRNELNFEGLIVTDSLAMGGLVEFRDHEKRTIATVNAGADVLVWPEEDVFDVIEKAVMEGKITEERINESACRVLEMKFTYGLLGDKKRELPPAPGERFEATAREIAERGTAIVLDSQNNIPLEIKPGTKILVAVVDDPYLFAGKDLRQYPPIKYALDELEARGAELTLMANPNCMTLRTMEIRNIHYDCMVALVSQLPMYEVRLSGWCAEILWLMNHHYNSKVFVISLENPFIQFENPGTTATIINACSACKESQQAAIRILCGEIPGTRYNPYKIDIDRRPMDAWNALD